MKNFTRCSFPAGSNYIEALQLNAIEMYHFITCTSGDGEQKM